MIKESQGLALMTEVLKAMLQRLMTHARLLSFRSTGSIRLMGHKSLSLHF